MSMVWEIRRPLHCMVLRLHAFAALGSPVWRVRVSVPHQTCPNRANVRCFVVARHFTVLLCIVTYYVLDHDMI